MIYHRLSRIFIFSTIFILSTITAMANEYNYSSYSKCLEFYKLNSKQFNNGSSMLEAIHIGDGKYIAYSSEPFTHKELIKKDEILGLYLFQGEIINSKYDIVKINKNIQTIAINSNDATLGKILKKQDSISNFAKFSTAIKPNSIISDICYQIYGISNGSDNFIDKTYIDRFLGYDDINSKEVTNINETNIQYNQNKKNMTGQATSPVYSYLGIEVVHSKDGVKITSINPLLNTKLKIGDIIFNIDNKQITNIYDFNNISSNLKVDSIVEILVRRNDKIISANLNVKRRLTPFNKETSFMAAFGILLNPQLQIEEIYEENEFKQGDKILRINQIKVSNIDELNDAITKVVMNGEDLSFLLNRDKFEFFITKKIRGIDENNTNN